MAIEVRTGLNISPVRKVSSTHINVTNTILSNYNDCDFEGSMTATMVRCDCIGVKLQKFKYQCRDHQVKMLEIQVGVVDLA